MPAKIRYTHAQETKKVILETALRLFEEKSYSTVSVDEIVNAAGTSKGAFYYHFKSKDDLIIYEYAQSDEFYEEIYENEIIKYTSAADRLIVFVQKQSTHTMTAVNSDMLKVLLASHLTNKKLDGILTDSKRSFNRIILKIVQYGQQQGEFRTDISQEDIANSIIRSIRGIHYDWAIQGYDLFKETTFFFQKIFIPGLVCQV